MYGSVLLLRKPPGLSSFKALYPVKDILGKRKVGHTGTLDPFAEGVMVVLCGYTTRLATWFSGLDKRYIATIEFGTSTDTLDPEGTISATAETPDIETIRSVITRFTGPIQQTPPAFSAISIGGKRAYRAAREGRPLDIPPREIVIHDLRLIDYTPPVATVDVRCSKGTYIRSLARDIASACGSVAYVTRLNRLAVGPFELDEIGNVPWITLDPVTAIKRIGSPPILRADCSTAMAIKNGVRIDSRRLDPSPEEDGEYAIVDGMNALLAVVLLESAGLTYRFVVPSGTPCDQPPAGLTFGT